MSSRAAIEYYHRNQLSSLQRHAQRCFEYYTPFRGRHFEEWPAIDKAELLAKFARMNVAGLSAAELRALLAEGCERHGNYVIGQSTGTSGNRGYYLISDAERFVWLGTILAKTLPDALWRRHRVALALPGLSSLYRSATSGSRISLGFFDLAQGIESWEGDLARFAPDTIVAPPKVLRWLAERGRLGGAQCFSGAEVLDPLDRQIIEAATGRKLREIYMATEGLFGVGCTYGVLHLAEDVVHFQWERPVRESLLQAPIVTDFTRRSQALIRYRMNDLLELDERPCFCGSAFQAVRRIEGRADDIFRLRAADGGEIMVTPDVLRNAIVDSDPAIQDFRVTQIGPAAIEIALSDSLPGGVEAAVHRKFLERLAPFGVAPVITVVRGLYVPFDHKLRRVRRAFR